MNDVRLTGRVLNAYRHDLSGAFITKIAVRHDHIVGRQSISCESVFNVVMLDEAKINLADWKTGDTVMITGYLKVDFKKSEKFPSNAPWLSTITFEPFSVNDNLLFSKS